MSVCHTASPYPSAPSGSPLGSSSFDTTYRFGKPGTFLRPTPWLGGGSSSPKRLENASNSPSVIAAWPRTSIAPLRCQRSCSSPNWPSPSAASSTPSMAMPNVPASCLVRTSVGFDRNALDERLPFGDLAVDSPSERLRRGGRGLGALLQQLRLDVGAR